MVRSRYAKCLFLLAAMFLSHVVFAQGLPWPDDPPAQSDPKTAPQDEPKVLSLEAMVPQVATTTAPSTVTIPAGTRVMMVLKSPLHTTSGTAGSGLYLETLYPVVQDNGVVIPAHTQVQGVVEANERPGHVKRESEFRFRFTTLIFPNNFVAPIQGVLQSIPGAKNIRTRDTRGTLKPVDQAEKVVIPAAAGAVGGAIIGAHRGYGIGLLPGAGLGAALGLGAVLLKRGDEINLVRGTNVEMILQAPLNLEQAQVAANARYGARSVSSRDPVIDCAFGDVGGPGQYPATVCGKALARQPVTRNNRF
jgi:type IV secretion system protein VirB10